MLRARLATWLVNAGSTSRPRRVTARNLILFFCQLTDACADDGRTALHLAAGEGASRVATKLVELGADVKKADRQGRNALDIARAAGYYDLEARLRLLAET